MGSQVALCIIVLIVYGGHGKVAFTDIHCILRVCVRADFSGVVLSH